MPPSAVYARTLLPQRPSTVEVFLDPDILPNDPSPFPARGGEVDWGLALSGGGLRSAAFSIGAMKALYDAEIMDKIDVISSVSGGGYASYWLYSRYMPGDTRFGAGAFGEARFSYNV